MLEWKAPLLTLLITFAAVFDPLVDAVSNWNW